MRRIQDLEGYLLIDHRNSPGISAQDLHSFGLPADAGQGIYEGATYTCGHCQRGVFVNSLRTRERHICRVCMHVMCDECAAAKALSGVCHTFDQKVDEMITAAEVAALRKE